MTPSCRSANTLVVPPWREVRREFGDGDGGCSVAVEASTSIGGKFDIDKFRCIGEVEVSPSSASARALPVSIVGRTWKGMGGGLNGEGGRVDKIRQTYGSNRYS